MKLLKEIRTPANSMHARIIGNNFLTVEIIQPRDTKSITDLKIRKDQAFLVQGMFKFGFYVSDIAAAETYLREKKVVIKHETFEDQDTHCKSFIIEDNNGFLIQVLQQINP